MIQRERDRDGLAIAAVFFIAIGAAGLGALAWLSSDSGAAEARVAGAAPPDEPPAEARPSQPPDEPPAAVSGEPAGVCRRDRQEIFATLARHIAEINACVEDEKRRAALPKELALSFVVSPDGSATELALGGEHNGGDLHQCLSRAFTVIRFPAAAGGRCPVEVPVSVASGGAPAASGGAALARLSREDVVGATRDNAATLMPCLKQARAAGDLQPGPLKLELDWDIQPDGSVARGRLQGPAALRRSSLAECIATAIDAWRFPASPTRVPVRNFPIPITVR